MSSQYLIARPALHRDDLEIRAQAEVRVEHPRELGDGHAVPHRDRKLADERLEAVLEDGAFDLHAANRVGPVADDHLEPVSLRRTQAVGHRVDEGVDAGTDVLQVDDQRVEPRQHFGGRLARLTVKRVDRHAPPPVFGVRGLDHVVLEVGPKPVLRAEYRGQRDLLRRRDAVDDMPEGAVNRGRVGDDPDA